MGGEAQGGWASQGKGAGLCQAGVFCRLPALISICSGHRERCLDSRGHADINTPLPSGSQALRQEGGPDRSSCHPRLLSSLSHLCPCQTRLGAHVGRGGVWWGGSYRAGALPEPAFPRLETPLHVHVGDFTSISWTVFPKPPRDSSAVDTAVSNQVQVLPLNSLLWPSGYLFLRMESIWYYYELLFLISVIIVWLY